VEGLLAPEAFGHPDRQRQGGAQALDPVLHAEPRVGRQVQIASWSVPVA
jgi:hypothetical protein